MDPVILQKPADCEIVTERLIHYSPSAIFRAFTDPDILKIWWGPAGFTNTFHSFDLRPGGKWIFTMHGPEKGNYQNESEFLVIEPPSRLIFNHISPPVFQVQVYFLPAGTDQTHLIFKQVFHTVAECEKIRKYTVGKNDENLDKLEKVLGTSASSV